MITDDRDLICGHELQPIAVIYDRAIALVVIIVMVIIVVIILPSVRSYYRTIEPLIEKERNEI